MKPWNNPLFIIFACVTLGLAPYTPEPHLLGKIRWVAGGATGMKTMDWFDLFFHALPWALLFRYLVLKFVLKKI